MRFSVINLNGRAVILEIERERWKESEEGRTGRFVREAGIDCNYE